MIAEDAPAPVGAIGNWRTWPTLVDLGATEADRHGFDVHASIVQMPRGDTRVRFTLRKNGEVIRHLDITAFHAMRLGPLLQAGLPAGKAR